jgi:hypothetical protein
LSRSLADLSVGYGEHAVLGVEALGGGEDGLARGAGPFGAQGSGCRHAVQSTPIIELSQAIDLIS